MTDQELDAMTIDERNRVLDAWQEETKADLETIAELEAEYARIGVQV